MLGIQIHLQIGYIIQFLSSRCIKRVLKTVCIYCIFTDLQLPFAKDPRASMPLPSWSVDQMIPADIRGGFRHGPSCTISASNRCHALQFPWIPHGPRQDGGRANSCANNGCSRCDRNPRAGRSSAGCTSGERYRFPERRALIADSTSRIWSCALTENVRRRKESKLESDHQIDLCKSWTSFRLIRSIIIN